METISIITIFQYGTPFILLVLTITNVINTLSIQQLVKDVEKMKNAITWKDTCNERHKEIDRRLSVLEK